MTLFVAEKELQARDIAHALVEAPVKRVGHYVCGDDIITWSFGHIFRQYEPHEYDERFADRRNVDILPIVPPPEGWKIFPDPQKLDLLETIQDLMRRANVIVNACDPDREGQLIFDEILDNTPGIDPNVKIFRLNTSGGLSPKAIRVALGEMTLNAEWRPQTEAALSRSQTDWLDGMNQSRAVAHAWYKSVWGDKGAIAYGRVLIPTVALVVARDEEIEKFVARDYYVGYAVFERGPAEFLTQWQAPPNIAGLDDRGRVVKREVIDHMVARVKGQRGKVVAFTSEEELEQAPLPHNLLTLQAAADRAYGLSAKAVLTAAQSLYAERLMITYPRTKSKYMPDGDHENAISVIHAISQNDKAQASICDGADPTIRSRAFDSMKMKDGKQAITPLPVYVSTDTLSEPEKQVYDLICRAYLAQFYPATVYEKRHVEIVVDADRFLADRKIEKSPGWRVCYPNRKPPSNAAGELPIDLRAGERPTCIDAATVAKKTEPPRRYTNASLLERMVNIDALVPDEALRKKLAETDGLGTDATRGDIIERAVEKYNYLERRGSELRSTWRARALVHGLPEILTSPVLTATLELILDQIALGEVARADYLEDYAQHLTEQLEVTKNIRFTATPPTDDDAAAENGTAGGKGKRTGIKAKRGTRFTVTRKTA
jgi:DNA topoisomerase-3